MATVEARINSWALEELRGSSQINMDVAVAWYKKGLQIFQKTMLEYVSGMQNTSHVFDDIKAGEDEYKLPLGNGVNADFYSIIQLRIAYHTTSRYSVAQRYSRYDSSALYYKKVRKNYVEENNPQHANLLIKRYYVLTDGKYKLTKMYEPYSSGTTYYKKIGNSYEQVTAEYADCLTKTYYILAKEGYPLYRICKPINFGDYNIRPLKNFPETGDTLEEQGGRQVGGPYVRGGISEINPRFVFIDKNHIKIFPTPIQDVENGLTLTYNYMEDIDSIDKDTNEDNLNLPRYFFDAIEDYMTFRLYQAENPEMAQWYYQQFESTLNDNIYGLNKDKRPVEEGFANTTYFSHY